MQDPWERKRTIADIISTIATFKDKIKWILAKDLKPRVPIGMKSDGTPTNPHDDLGFKIPGPSPKLKSDYNLGGGVTAVFTSAPNKATEVLAIQASYKMGVGVADRQVELRVPDMGLGGVAATAPADFFWAEDLTPVTAGQYAYLLVSGEANMVWAILNGTRSKAPNLFPTKLWFGPGADIQAMVTTNNQSDEDIGIDVLYREWPLEVVA